MKNLTFLFITLITAFIPAAIQGEATSLKILILVDTSGSMVEAHINPPTITEIRDLAEAVADAGGDIAYGHITSSPEPFLRIHFDPLPTAPQTVAVEETNIFLTAKSKAEQQAKLDAYQRIKDARATENNSKIQSFLDNIAILKLQPPAISTDILDALTRASIYFAEPTTQPTTMYFSLNSDGKDTTGRALRASFPQGLTIIVVHNDSDIGILAKLAPRPIIYENTSIALMSILQRRR